MPNIKQNPKSKIQITKGENKRILLDASGEYVVELVGEGAQVEIVGKFLAIGNESKEVSVILYHRAAHTRANTILKGVARDQSFIKFVGRIIIEKDCPDTQSFLEERVLLLSDEARAETVPDLEIESDDVKCSHAASISNLDEGQLFYLMSRGIDRVTAEEMVVEGFLNDQ